MPALSSPSQPRRTAFVLAGGGSLGAVEVGMLRELLAWDVDADAWLTRGADFRLTLPTQASVELWRE